MIYTVSAHTANAQESRTFGYFEKLEEAREAVLRNHGDIRECLYDYVVIESMPAGLLVSAEGAEWFEWKWGSGTWASMKAPPLLAAGTTNFSMG